MAEKLQSVARGEIAPAGACVLVKDELRPERVVQLVEHEGAGMDWARHEFPEWLEVLEHRLVGVEVMRGRVMHVGGDPERVADAGTLDEREDIDDLELASERRSIALRDRLDAPVAVGVVDPNEREQHV